MIFGICCLGKRSFKKDIGIKQFYYMEKHIRIMMLQLDIYKLFRMLVKKIVGEVKR